MGHQIHKRLPLEFVVDVLRAFCEEEIEVNKACELLGVSKVQLYRLRKRYLTCQKEGKEFKLYKSENKTTRAFPKEVQDFLHKELDYISFYAEKFNKKFNFSFSAERAEKKLGYPFHRNSIRRFALRHGYYHTTEKIDLFLKQSIFKKG